MKTLCYYKVFWIWNRLELIKDYMDYSWECILMVVDEEDVVLGFETCIGLGFSQNIGKANILIGAKFESDDFVEFIEIPFLLH